MLLNNHLLLLWMSKPTFCFDHWINHHTLQYYPNNNLILYFKNFMDIASKLTSLRNYFILKSIFSIKEITIMYNYMLNLIIHKLSYWGKPLWNSIDWGKISYIKMMQYFFSYINVLRKILWYINNHWVIWVQNKRLKDELT